MSEDLPVGEPFTQAHPPPAPVKDSRRFLGSIVTFIVAVLAGSAWASDFRGNSWYDTAAEVKEREQGTPLEQATDSAYILQYTVTLFDEQVTLEYLFDPYCRQLIVARYYFPRDIGSTKFWFIIQTLENKYGEWSENHSVYSWRTARTEITAIQASNMSRNEGNTTITYRTSNFQWWLGFKEDTAPSCPEMLKLQESLEEKL